VTLAFAAVVALLFVATGTFIYLRFETELDQAIDAGLRSRANDVAALIKKSGGQLRTGDQSLVARTESFAEVLDARGRVSDSSQAVGPKDR
jgi:hypothetical protein